MKKKTRWPLYAILALVLTFLAFVVPLPYYIEVPGGAEDIRQVLKVNETEDTEAGACNSGYSTRNPVASCLCLVNTFYGY